VHTVYSQDFVRSTGTVYLDTAVTASMGLDLNNPLVQLKLLMSVCGGVAFAMTMVRMWIKRGRYWWDDGWAFFSLLCLFTQFAGAFMHVPNPEQLSKVNRVAAYYILAASFYGVIWSARLSILFSVIRIESDPRRQRVMVWVGVVFVAALFFFVAQLLWVCEPEPRWKDLPSPQCTLARQVPICQVISDVLADLFLIIAPIRTFRKLRDQKLRRRLVVIFSTIIITSIVSLIHAALIFEGFGNPVLLAGVAEDSVSLMVANIPVLAAAALHSLGRGTAEDDSSGPRLSVTTMLSFTPNSRTAAHNPSGGGRRGLKFARMRGVESSRAFGDDSANLSSAGAGAPDDKPAQSFVLDSYSYALGSLAHAEMHHLADIPRRTSEESAAYDKQKQGQV